MKYNLNNLNPYDFEHLVQSLSRIILGNGTISFGAGSDGGREATFDGKAPFPSQSHCWEGYWVIQAKFRDVKKPENENDFTWIKNELKKELEKYSSRKSQVKHPDNYLLITNIILTAAAKTGGRDKANHLEIEYQKLYKIKNIRIISCDDICDMLDINRDLAIAYAPFIMAGDVLSKLLEMLNVNEKRVARINEIIARFLEAEFLEDVQSKLDHAGKLTSDKINLEKVFIDLFATEDGLIKHEKEKFIDSTINKGNSILKYRRELINRFVLIAGPGYGKSTLTQFLAQIYRAYFLKNIDKCDLKINEIDYFIIDFLSIVANEPKWIRFPIRIILKDYAGWLKNAKSVDDCNTSITEYIKFNINKKSSSGDITNIEVENLISNLPTLFVFDGLDEVPISSNRKDVLNEINSFTDTILRRINADTIIIATTRPQGYSEDFDSDKYKHLRITDLTTVDCSSYLQKLTNNIIDNTSERENKYSILLQALGHKEISRLMKSPLQASIMAILVKSGGEPPRNRYDLFAEYFNTIFTREKQRGVSSILSNKPKYVKEIHYLLGFYLQADSEINTNPSATIKNEEFKNIVSNYLTKYGLEEAQIISISKELLSVAMDRLVFISEIEDEKIGFAIRSLQEYFAAIGYVQKTKDEDIRKTLLTISKNSYWNNTLLFAIAHLFRIKEYAVDNVESICHELNGSRDDNDCKSLSAIPKMGSWLALDLLNEGIFRDTPVLENIFCKLLEDLFYISPNFKHEELAKLPLNLLDKWVLKFLQVSFEKKNNNNLTNWYICIYLYKNDYNVMGVVEKNWPGENEIQVQVIKLFIQNKIYNNFIFDVFFTLLLNNSKSEFWDLFSNTSYSNFILRLSNETYKKNQKVRNAIVEICFINYLLGNFDFNTYGKIFMNLGVKLSLRHQGLRPDNYILKYGRYLDIEIANNFTYQVSKSKIIDKEDINDIYKIYNGIELLERVCLFFVNPELDVFIRLNNTIQSLDEKYQKIIIDSLAQISSFIRWYYNGKFDKTDQMVTDTLNEIDEYSSDYFNHVEKTQLIITGNLYTKKRLSGINFIETLVSFIHNYISEDCEKEISLEFFFLTNWIIRITSDKELHKIESSMLILNTYLDSIRIFLGSATDITYYDISNIFYFFDIDSIEPIVLKYFDKIYTFNISFSYRYEYSSYVSSKYSVINFKKMCELLKLQILLKHKVVYKVILQEIIFLNEMYADLVLFIPFKEILYSNPEQEEIYKALLLLLDKKYNKTHYCFFIKTMGLNSTIFSQTKFVKCLLYILRLSPNNNYIDSTLLYIDNKLTACDFELRSEFENLVKNYVNNKPTNIRVDDYA